MPAGPAGATLNGPSLSGPSLGGPTPGGPTRLSLPARAAYDLDTLGKELGSLAERLGHPVCISGDLCIVQFSDLLDEPVAA